MSGPLGQRRRSRLTLPLTRLNEGTEDSGIVAVLPLQLDWVPMLLRILLSVVPAVLIGGAALAETLEDGSAAYDRGDYALALRLLRPLAEQGNIKAQKILGDMYNFGLGVAEDYAEGAKWHRKGAEKGDIECQYLLGLMYEFGSGVPMDLVQAHMWFNLSAAQGDAPPSRMARDGRMHVEKNLTSEELARARQLAREWMNTH